LSIISFDGNSVSTSRTRTYSTSESTPSRARATGRPGIADIFRMGIDMVHLIQTVHSQNIIHGDIDWDSFVCQHAKPSCGHLRILGFDRAKIFNAEEIEREVTARGERGGCFVEHHAVFYTSVWLSPWEMRDCVTSLRDDVYRVMLVLGFLIHGDMYNEYMRFLTAAKMWNFRPDLARTLVGHYVNAKDSGDVFEVNPIVWKELAPHFKIFKPRVDGMAMTLESIMPGKAQLVRAKLRRLMAVVIGGSISEDPNLEIARVPEYEKIRDILDEIVQLIETPSSIRHVTFQK
jgi:hypothetical protein